MKKTISFSVAILLLLPAWISASMVSKQPFSADLYFQAPGGREIMVMRTYFSDDRMRVDRIRGRRNSGIVRLDRNTIWSLNHSRQTYWEIPLAPVPEFHLMDLDGTTLHRTRLGPERRNGVLCEKLRVRYEDPRGGRTGVATAWFGIEQGTYVRIEHEDGTVFNLRNIRMGPQPAHLFTTPRHYRMQRAGTPPAPHAGRRGSRDNHGPPWYGRPPTVTPPADPTATRTVPVLRDGRLFPNSDFEDGTLRNWTAKGDAFRFQPTRGDNLRARNGRHPSRHQKRYWIGTYEKYGGRPGERPGRTQGNRPTGTLTSIPFEITHERIDFVIGGGNRAAGVYVALLINGKAVRRATGGNQSTLQRTSWQVGQYAGRRARILIADNGTGHRGHINADDFRYGGKAMVQVRYVPAPRGRRSASESP